MLHVESVRIGCTVPFTSWELGKGGKDCCLFIDRLFLLVLILQCTFSPENKYFLFISLRFVFFLQDKIFYDHVVQPVLKEDNEIGVRSLSESEDKIRGSFSLMYLFDSITYNKVKKHKILPVSFIF